MLLHVWLKTTTHGSCFNHVFYRNGFFLPVTWSINKPSERKSSHEHENQHITSIGPTLCTGLKRFRRKNPFRLIFLAPMLKTLLFLIIITTFLKKIKFQDGATRRSCTESHYFSSTTFLSLGSCKVLSAART